MDAAQHLPEIITMQNVNKSYKMGANSLHVLKDISLTVEKGEYLAILGPSGSGKSMFPYQHQSRPVRLPGQPLLRAVKISTAKLLPESSFLF